MPPDQEIEAKVRAAVERLAKPAVKTPKAAPKPVPEMPDAFASALDGADVRARFDAMPSGYRREYIEWVAEAKTDATRDKRIAQSVAWIGEGKHRNWKYQKC